MKSGTSNLRGAVHYSLVTAVLFGLSCCLCVRAANEPSSGASAQKDVLTPELRQWLAESGKTIRIGVNFIPPLVFGEPETGGLMGLCIDFIREIEHILATRFEVVYYPTWNEMMGAAFMRDIDVVYAAQRTPSREAAFLFTEPYLQFDNKIITTEDIGGPLTLDDLAGKTVAVVAGAAIEEHLQLNYPAIRLMSVDDELIGLTRVSFNQADAMVVEIARASWYIQQNKFTNLHISGDAGYVFALGFASRSDRPELTAIFNAALGRIGPQRRKELVNRWIFPEERERPDLRFLLAIAGIAAFLLLAIFVWNRLLSLQVRRHTTQLQRELNVHQEDMAALQRYETIISLSGDQMLFMDSAGVIRAANDAYLKAVELPREEVIGRTSQDILGEAFFERYIHQRLEKAMAGQTTAFELWVEHTQKGRRYIRGVYHPYKTADGSVDGVVLVIHDITDIQMARQELADREELLSSLVLALPVGVGLFKNRAIVRVNQKICDMIGYSEAELIGQNSRMLYPTQEEYIRVGAELYPKIQQDGIGMLETRWQRKDGQVIDVLLSSAALDSENPEKGTTISAMDITDRKQAERDLIESRNLLQSILNTIPVRVFWKDRNLNYLGCNQPFALDAGLTGTDRIAGKSDFDLGWQDRIEQYRKDDLEVISTGRSKYNYEEPLATSDGRRICLLTSKVPLLGADGSIRGVLGTYQDITERKQAEEARELLLKELQSKNEELQSIVFIASHDLRSPLVNIRGFAGELEKSFEDICRILNEAGLSEELLKKLSVFLESDIPESLRFIDISGRKMEVLLNGLLRLSRISTTQIIPVTVNMDQLLGGILGGLGFKIRENNIDITVEGELPSCRGDLTLINQVFTNLIDNAVKYRDLRRPCRIRIRGRKEDGQSVYEIEDNGIGIAAEHQQKVFDIFHQLNPGAGGDGLGLTIVRRILNRQNGTIRLVSELGTGTTVYVALPGEP